MSTDLVKSGETRVITVFSQRDNSSKDVHTDVQTWGQFLQQNAQEFDLKNIRGVVRETKHVLEVDDALMPEGNFTLFLFPKKVKSGLSMKTKDEYLKSENRDSLRKLCRQRKLSATGGKDELAQRLANDDITKAGAPKEEASVVHASTKSKAVAPISAKTNFATVEAATVETTIRARINDAAQLSGLLEAMFPNMKVVSVDAVVDLTAKLELGTALPAVAPVEEQVIEEVEEVEEVKTPSEKASVSSSEPKAKKEKKPATKAVKVSEKPPSDEQLKKEANDMAGFFK